MTNGDMLVTGAGGAKGIIIMATDYSNGNDQIVAKPGRIVKGFCRGRCWARRYSI
jgi:hypothetical protein